MIRYLQLAYELGVVAGYSKGLLVIYPETKNLSELVYTLTETLTKHFQGHMYPTDLDRELPEDLKKLIRGSLRVAAEMEGISTGLDMATFGTQFDSENCYALLLENDHHLKELHKYLPDDPVLPSIRSAVNTLINTTENFGTAASLLLHMTTTVVIMFYGRELKRNAVAKVITNNDGYYQVVDFNHPCASVNM